MPTKGEGQNLRVELVLRPAADGGQAGPELTALQKHFLCDATRTQLGGSCFPRRLWQAIFAASRPHPILSYPCSLQAFRSAHGWSNVCDEGWSIDLGD